MSDATAFLLRAMEENWIHARQAEDKRAVIAHVNITAAMVATGIMALVGFKKNALPLTFLLVILGIYGIAATAKLYERSQYHIHRARKLRAKLDELYPDAQVEMLQKSAETEHRVRYPRLMNVHLNTIWLSLHTLIAVLGVVYTIIIL
jgi:hypothetical protein